MLTVEQRLAIYKECRYEPKAALADALRRCEGQMADLRFILSDIAVSEAMCGRWDDERWAWREVLEYVSLQLDLERVCDHFAAMRHPEPLNDRETELQRRVQFSRIASDGLGHGDD